MLTAVLLFAGFYVFAGEALDSAFFYPGTIVDGENISGMSYDEALNLFMRRTNGFAAETALSIRYDSMIHDITGDKLGIADNITAVLDEAWLRCRRGSLPDRFNALVKLRSGRETPLISSPVFDRSMVDAFVEAFAAEYYLPPRNASMVLLNGAFVFEDEQMGSAIDTDALADAVWRRLLDGSREAVHARAYAVEPELTRDMLERSVSLLAEVATKLPEDEARITNIRTIASAINGSIIIWDEDFSINKATGERTQEKGYKRVVLTGQGDDNGAGQFAGTFYRCALLAGMDVVQRERPPTPAAYLPIGFDAALEWDAKDLVMRNSTGAALYINCEVLGDELRVALYGMKRDNGASIKLSGEIAETVSPSETVIIFDAIMPDGQTKTEVEPRNGYRINTYRRFYSGGELTKEEQLTEDYYPAVRGRMRMGTQK